MGFFVGREETSVQDGRSQSSSCSTTAPSVFTRSKSCPQSKHIKHNWNLPFEDFEHRNYDVSSTRARRKVKRRQRINAVIRSSLEQEIQHLEKRLSSQYAERFALERALGYRSSSTHPVDNTSMPKRTKELMWEISMLEMEVIHFERCLLSLYRKAFDQQLPKLPTHNEDEFQHKMSYEGVNPPLRQGDIGDTSNELMLQRETFDSLNEYGLGCADKLGSAILRSHSALSQQSHFNKVSPQTEKINEALLRSCHSQPLSFLEHAKNDIPQAISLAEYLGTSIADHIPETPNELSEDLVRCVGSIYCKIVKPSVVCPGVSSSPTSSCSSTSPVSPQYLGVSWNSSCRKKHSFHAPLENPYQLGGLKAFNGPYSQMQEVSHICTDSESLKGVEDLLMEFRLLIDRLEKVDFKRMKEDENKLAFWINIHNALVMHKYLEDGIPKNNLKKSLILFKASCNIGGHIINAEIIQNTILGYHTQRPGQWLRTFVSPKSKSRSAEELKKHAIEHLEPLLYFALCSGSHSDPAVRVYTPKEVFQQLETAKEQYIQAAVSIHKEQKIMLPRILESFARASNMCSRDLLNAVQQCLPETLRIVMKRCQAAKQQKCIEWIPQNFTFRYLLSRELVCPVTTL